MIYEGIINRRTIRKFRQKPVAREILIKCVDAARLSPSGMNRQPLKYIIVDDESLLPEVFSTLTWARNIPGFKHAPDEIPAAYIIMLLDKTIGAQPGDDPGIASMSISMTAYEEGVASCILGSVDRLTLAKNLKIPDHFQILLVVALGYPAEKSKAVELRGDDTKYWYAKDEVLNVPKRSLKDIVFWNIDR